MFTFSSKDKRLFIYRMRPNCVGSAVSAQRCLTTTAVATSILQKTGSTWSDLHNKTALNTIEALKNVFLSPTCWMDAAFSETTSTQGDKIRLVNNLCFSLPKSMTAFGSLCRFGPLGLVDFYHWSQEKASQSSCFCFFQRTTWGETVWLLPNRFVFLSSWWMFAANKLS